MRDEDEIYDEIGRVSESRSEHGGNRWQGMTYEDGVDAALRWALGESDEAPMNE